jgi:type II secretory pathway pseudopilin PulG
MTSLRAVAVLGAALLAPAVASAQEANQQEQLEQRIQSLEAALAEIRREQDQPPVSGDSAWEVGYDKGFFIRGRNSQSNPFSLQINGRLQFRYTDVMPDSDSYDNLASGVVGIPIPVKSRNDFEMERARLSFAGTAFDPKLRYYINLDGDTDDAHTVIFHDYWFDYQFSKGFDLYAGKAFVPGSREWLGGSTSTHLIDRSMATSFFRPDRSLGIWAIGEPLDGLNYRAMLGNGFQTTDLEFDQINENLMGSASVWWEPGEGFGKGYADLKAEDSLRTRFGSSFTHSAEDARSGLIPTAESNFLRLDDGSRLTVLGVDKFDVSLLSVDAAMKLAGFSLHGEGYYRWVDNIEYFNDTPTTEFDDSSNTAYGGYVGAGYMLMPSKLDVQLRYSAVHGDLKDSAEYAGGFNYYIDGTHGNKISLDLTHLDGSPTSSSGPNYTIGQDGWMVRLQLQLSF